jgi:putative FmdB family regulatory protein
LPTYEYRCPNCGKRFEDFRPMTAPDVCCPICGVKAKRLISAGAGFLFKGTGFYITDHRSPEYKRKIESDKGKEKPTKKSA